jgi:hypothetical protein
MYHIFPTTLKLASHINRAHLKPLANLKEEKVFKYPAFSVTGVQGTITEGEEG